MTKVTLKTITSEVAAYYNVDVKMIMVTSKNKTCNDIRKVIAWLAYTSNSATYKEIADFLGWNHVSSVYAAIKKMEDFIACYSIYKNACKHLYKKLFHSEINIEPIINKKFYINNTILTHSGL
jgi:chromosomal replication initiation ATPase DnaA